MYHEMKIAGLTRRLPLCPISDDTQIGAFIMFGDMELTTASASELLTRAPEFDVIVTAESKGIPLACDARDGRAAPLGQGVSACLQPGRHLKSGA